MVQLKKFIKEKEIYMDTNFKELESKEEIINQCFGLRILQLISMVRL